MDVASAYKMTTSEGVAIPLVGVTVRAVLKDTALEATVNQQYQNTEEQTIEAVYTFALPTGAQLMSLVVSLNGEQYSGEVVEARKAEARYEEAITDGDTAMRLQQVSDSLYTLNLGNLQPGDHASIEIRYAQLLEWQGEQLRLLIPTTMGERFGDPQALGMEPHQQTRTDPGVDYRAEFSVRIEGQLASSMISCPSHAVALQRVKGLSEEGGLLIRPDSATVAMDRDFILLLKRPEGADSAAYYDRDIDGQWVGWLSLNPTFDEPTDEQLWREPRTLNIVVDCSGSMAGVSMQQAKVAVREIVSQLCPEDSFNITNFGSHHQSLFSQPVVACEKNKADAYRWIRKTQADLGGTEMADALKAAYGDVRLCDSGSRADLLLITDGQTYDLDNVLKTASASGHRHFTVGVGSAVAEDLVRGLAEATAGACELVTPSENMAAAIVRHCQRSGLPAITRASITWPAASLNQSPDVISHAFSGDTLQVFSQFGQAPFGEVVVAIEFGEQVWRQAIVLQPYCDVDDERSLDQLLLARMAATQRLLKAKTDEEKIGLGIHYQLQSSLTHYLMVVERETKDECELGPMLRQVPQMTKAYLHSPAFLFSRRGVVSEQDPSDGDLDYSLSGGMSWHDDQNTDDSEYLDIPAFLRRESGQPPVDLTIATAGDFVRRLNYSLEYTLFNLVPRLPSDIHSLEVLGVDRAIAGNLRLLVNNVAGFGEGAVVVAYLYCFMQRCLAADDLSRNARRTINKAFIKRCPDPSILDDLPDMQEAIEAELDESWQLQPVGSRID